MANDKVVVEREHGVAPPGMDPKAEPVLPAPDVNATPPPIGPKRLIDASPAVTSSTCSIRTLASLGEENGDTCEDDPKESVVQVLDFTNLRDSDSSSNDTSESPEGDRPETVYLNAESSIVEPALESIDKTLQEKVSPTVSKEPAASEEEEEKNGDSPHGNIDHALRTDEIGVKASFFCDACELVVPSLTNVQTEDDDQKAVYIQDKKYGSLPAKILEERDSKAVVIHDFTNLQDSDSLSNDSTESTKEDRQESVYPTAESSIVVESALELIEKTLKEKFSPTVGKERTANEEEEEKKEDSRHDYVDRILRTDEIEVKSSFFYDEYELIVPSLTNVQSEDNDQKAVYIQDKKYGWLPATILEERDSKAVVQVKWPDPSTTVVFEGRKQPETVTVDYKNYAEEELPLQNSQAKQDMVDLVHLHDAAILYNLQQRHADLQPYTRVGEILVAMNPFQWIDSLYTTECQEEYTHKLIGKDFNIENELLDYKSYFDRLGLEPHVYEISTSAYRGLVRDKQDQTILVTGETGAGKTETVKILMSHLATIPKNSAMDIVTRVCQSSPVFEAFGNAQTLRNNNSSRFGKFTQLQFRVEDANADMVGSFCTTYLLEKTRVVSHAPGERTYHIFYQLMAASPEFKSQLWPFFAIIEAKDFAYLCHSSDIQPHLHADTERWAETMEALSLFQFTGEKLHELMRALGIVLQLGNLVFNDVNNGGYGEHNTVITSIFELERLSEMTGIEFKELEESMTCRILKTGSEDIKVKAPPQVAKEWCDALAKEIYAKLFDMMVRCINDSTAGGQNVEGLGHISLLDIFGFERFEVNRLEQLCINYANEKLHNKYVLDNFNAIKEEYEAEGVDLYDFSLVDNSDVLELMESPEGLIASLNEQCNLPRGNNDENFVSKIKRTNQRRSSFANNKLHNRSEFEVQHFAGPVVYDAHTFVERNMDKLPEGIGEIAAKSSNTLIKAEFERVEAETGPTTRRAAMKRNKFVFQKFQAQLRSLMLAMENSKTRYIRCIKPNSEFAPRKTDHLGTLHQLECSGLMTAIAMTREGYPDKLSYAIVGDRFACLMRAKEFDNIRGMELQQKVEVILSKWLKPRLIQCGKTRVYFKSGAKEQLEVLRLEYFHKAAVAIQSAVRRSQAMDSLSKSMKVTMFLQKSWRMTIEKNRFRRKIQSATRLSASMRRHLIILRVERMRQESAATQIQSQFRTQRSVGELRRTKRAAATIQKSVRKAQGVHHFASSRLAIVKLQSVLRMGGQSIAYKRQKNSATQVSSWFRVVQARKVTARMRKERDAASAIQKAARLALKKRQDSATIIQREYRRHSLKKKDHAAAVIQRENRSYNTTKILNALKQSSPGNKSNITTKMAGIFSSLFDIIDTTCHPGSCSLNTTKTSKALKQSSPGKESNITTKMAGLFSSLFDIIDTTCCPGSSKKTEI